MKVVSIDDLAVNGATDLQFGFVNDQDRPYEIDVRLQAREGRSPTVSGGQENPRELEFVVVPNKTGGDPFDVDAFEFLVHRQFRASLRPRRVLVERVPGDAATRMYAFGYVQRFAGDGDTREIYRGTILFPDGYWHAEDPATAATNPFTVGGNAIARPTVVLTTEEACTRVRVTVHDRTGNGVGGWLASAVWAHPQAETWVWANGVPLPFVVTAGRVWFRVDVSDEQDTLVDVFHAANATPGRWAGKMQSAGTTLDAALGAGTSVVADISTAGANPVSAALTWHPGITASHVDGTPYTFGLNADNQVILVDRQASGTRKMFNDDADSFVFSSPVEISQISSFVVNVASGVRVPEADDSESDDSENAVTTMSQRPACLRVKVATAGGPDAGGEYNSMITSLGGAAISDPTAFATATLGSSGNETYSREQFDEEDGYNGNQGEEYNLPEPTPRLVFALEGSEGDAVKHVTLHYNEPSASYDWNDDYWYRFNYMGQASVAQAIGMAIDGASVSNEGWTFYALINGYADVALPHMTIAQNTLREATVIEQTWVDPVTHEPIMDDSASGPMNGRVKVVLRYRRRDDETWYVAWSTIIDGTLDAADQEVVVPARTFPSGAVQVAVGLESVANGVSAIDWGVLTVDENPTLYFVAGKSPTIDVSAPIDAMCLDGTIRFNEGTLDESFIRCRGVFCDDGLELDADALMIRSADGQGNVYGEIEFEDQTNWVVLSPGENEYTLSGNLDAAEVTYTERLAI